METAKWIVATIVGLIVLAVLAFGLEWAGIKWYGFFGPKREAVRRQVGYLADDD